MDQHYSNFCEQCPNNSLDEQCCLSQGLSYFDELDSNDCWYLSTSEEDDSLIVRVSNRFYLWQNNEDLLELVPKKLESPIDYAQFNATILT